MRSFISDISEASSCASIAEQISEVEVVQRKTPVNVKRRTVNKTLRQHQPVEGPIDSFFQKLKHKLSADKESDTVADGGQKQHRSDEPCSWQLTLPYLWTDYVMLMLNVLKDYDQEFSSIMFIVLIIINIIVNIIKDNFSTLYTNMQLLKLNIFNVQNVICHLYRPTTYKYLNVLHYMHIAIMNPAFIIRPFIGIVDRI